MVFLSAFSVLMFISAVSQFYFSKQIIKFEMSSDSEAYFHIISFFLLSIICAPVTIMNCTTIYIDTFSKTISFRNIIINSTRIYRFDELQGYVESSYKVKGGTERVIYLVKDDKRVERITENYYSNYDELKQGLSSINYMGVRIFYFFEHLKILFRMTVYN